MRRCGFCGMDEPQARQECRFVEYLRVRYGHDAAEKFCRSSGDAPCAYERRDEVRRDAKGRWEFVFILAMLSIPIALVAFFSWLSTIGG